MSVRATVVDLFMIAMFIAIGVYNIVYPTHNRDRVVDVPTHLPLWQRLLVMAGNFESRHAIPIHRFGGMGCVLLGLFLLYRLVRG